MAVILKNKTTIYGLVGDLAALQAADALEATTRANEISAEAAARTTAVSNEATTRAAAVTQEVNDRVAATLMCAVIIYCTIWQTKTARTRFIINCIVAMLTIPIGVLLMHTMLLPVTLIIVYSALYSILTFEVINA